MLVLVGSGEYLPPMETVDRYLLAQLPKEPRVVCLPTAAGSEGPQRVAYWSQLGETHFSRLGAETEALPVIDQASANDPTLAERIRRANFVYLSGGRPNYLVNTLKDSLAWRAIQEVLAAGGILAGCSAGAMILGERIPAFPVWQRAFNLVPGAVVVPHYDEIPSSFARTMKMFVSRDKTLVGIEGNTALVKDGDVYSVLGQGGVTIWNSQDKIRYTQGQSVQWPVNGGISKDGAYSADR